MKVPGVSFLLEKRRLDTEASAAASHEESHDEIQIEVQVIRRNLHCPDDGGDEV